MHDPEPEIRVRGGALVFDKTDVMDAMSENRSFRTFVLGEHAPDYPGYFKILSRKINTSHNLYVHRSVDINILFFISRIGRITILDKIDRYVKRSIFIGGDATNAIPEDQFNELLRTFPNYAEIHRYVDARIQNKLRDFVGGLTDAEKKLSDFLKRHDVELRYQAMKPDIGLRQYERNKYLYMLNTIESGLQDPSLSEKDWEKMIVAFILLLYPKYVCVLHSVQIAERITRAKPTKRQFDVVLVDADGHIDLIEVKKPFENCVLRTSKYRDNYVPAHELSGAIMQAEKYILYLQKGGYACEETLNKKYSRKLPNNLRINVVNPKAIVVLGRSSQFNDAQRLDFEVIKRKYANIIDIVTYDDLIARLRNIITRLS